MKIIPTKKKIERKKIREGKTPFNGVYYIKKKSPVSPPPGSIAPGLKPGLGSIGWEKIGYLNSCTTVMAPM